MNTGTDARSRAYPQRLSVERLRPAATRRARPGASDRPIGHVVGHHWEGEQWLRR